jgi:diguanylate cyclase (GGDEF)-like protein
MNLRATKPAPAAPSVRRRASRARAAASAAAEPADLAIARVPEADLTPCVRAALLELGGEVERLRRKLDEARTRISHLERLADEDALMPIANRRGFVRELSRMMSFARRYGTPSSIVYFDVDGLKAINDRYGHAAGDAALQHVGRVLVENVRSSDVVGRLGGDEFAVLLVQTDPATAEGKAAVLSAAIEAQPLLWQGEEIPLSAAYGTHGFTGGEENAADALDAADRAMYGQKRARRADRAG